MSTHTRCQIIKAPSREPPSSSSSSSSSHGVKNKKVFLAGSTSAPSSSSSSSSQDWREQLISSLADQPLTIYNPLRGDWDPTWREAGSCARFREQTEWELEMQDAADLVVVYFHAATQAPVSLLELGLCAKEEGKAVVVCPEGFWKRGNVQIVCERYGVEMVGDVGEVRGVILRKLGLE